MSQFYQFKAKDIVGNYQNFSDFKNKVVLIVNVASKCGFTKQYASLQKLYEKYENQGLKIFAFPCNQFLFQEPKNESEIQNFCTSKYHITFNLFSKINVNGKNTHPLYLWLKSQKPWTLKAKNVKWNFEKFLIDKQGKVINRFSSATDPQEFEQKIIKLLKEEY